MTRAAVLAFVLTLPTGALALSPPSSPASRNSDAGDSTPAEPQSHVFALRYSAPSRPDLPPESVRLALQHELGAPIRLSASTVPLLDISLPRPNEARVRFITPQGESSERTVELPQNSARAIEVIAWVAGNLARDEAAELIAEYRRLNPPSPGPAEGEGGTSAPSSGAVTKAAPAPAARAAQTSKGPGRNAAPSAAAAALAFAPVNLSLFHPLALYPDSHRRRVAIELGLAYGRLGALSGVGIELGLLSVDGAIDGVALGGLALDVEGATTGYTAALIYSGSRGRLTGVDTSLVSYRLGDVRGAQLATVFTRAGNVDGVIAAAGLTLASDVRGATLAVGANLAGSAEGATLAAGANIVRRVDGAALAAGANVASEVDGLAAAAGANLVDRLRGASLAAGFNLSQDVHGLQLAPINVAKRVRGMQLGIVNVAEHVDGTAIGVISIAKNGEVQATAWASNFAPLHASVKFRVGFAYSEFGAAYDPSSGDYSFEQGLGAHIQVAGPFAVEPGVHHSYTQRDGTSLGEGNGDDYLHYRARGILRLGRHIDVFAGGGVRHGAWGNASGEVDPEVLSGIALH